MPPVVDRREARRKRAVFQGVVSSNGEKTTFRCIVRDYSQSGARIFVQPGVNLSDELFLIVVHDRITHQAEVVWYGEREAGLKFTRSIELNEPMSEQLVNRLWNEDPLR